MIFPQNPDATALAYYPYFFSTNMDYSYYNYFAPSFPALILPNTPNIVYDLKTPSPHQPPALQTPPEPSPLADGPTVVQNSEGINSEPEQTVRLCNRNVLPNNVSLILCFIRRVKKSGRMVERILARLNTQGDFSSKRFYAYQLYLKDNCTDFKWKQGIEVLVNRLDPNCPSFSLQEQAFYNRLTRVLIVQYLEQICRLEVLNHTKINPTHIRDHLRVIRCIRNSLRPHPRPKITIQYTP